MKFKQVLLKELTTTGTGEGYLTPKAFSKLDPKDNPVIKKWADIFGWEIAKKTNIYFKPLHEELGPGDFEKLKNFIRNEIAGLFYVLWVKRKMYTK